MTPPWWTAADQAELDLLLTEFLFAVESHDGWCGQCRDPDAVTRCDQFGEVVMAVCGYVELRSLTSYAQGMRQMQAVIDELGLGGLAEPERMGGSRAARAAATPGPTGNPGLASGSVSSSLPSNVVPLRRAL